MAYGETHAIDGRNPADLPANVHRFRSARTRAIPIWLSISWALLAAVVALRAWLARVGPLPGDRWAATRFQQPWLRSPAVKVITTFYQQIASPGPAIAIGACGLLLVWLARRPGALGGLIIACLAVPLNALAKFAFGPTELWVQAGRGGTNFPSGHASFVTAVGGYLGLLCWQMGLPWRWLSLVALLLVVGVGPARVVGGEHLPSDVIGGYMLGLAMLILAGLWLGQGGVPGLTERARARLRARARTS